MVFLKKHYGSILLLLLIGLLFYPPTGTPIKVFFIKFFAGNPVAIVKEEQQLIESYHWSLQSLDGEVVNFSRSKDRVALVGFWATWCPNCIAELPYLQKLYEKKNEALDFYFVTKEDPEVVRAFMQKNEYTFPVYMEMDDGGSLVEVRSIPRKLIISKDGYIVVDKTGAANWDDEYNHNLLDQLVAE